MRKNIKTWHYVAADVVLAIVAPLLSFFIRYDELSSDAESPQQFLLIPLVVLVRPALNMLFGLDRRMWRYASVRDVGRILAAVSAGSIVLVAVMFGLLMPLGIARGFPRSVIVIEWLLTAFGTGSIRLLARLNREVAPTIAGGAEQPSSEQRRMLVVGAGDVGATVIREVQADPQRKFVVVGLVDEDSRKLGKSIYGVRVLGTRRGLPQLIEDHRIEDIVIASPAMGAAAIRETMSICEASQTRVRIRTVPAMCEILNGEVPTLHLRLFRPEVQDAADRFEDRIEQARQHFAGRDVLITGGNGFIGAHLAQQLYEYGARVTVLDVTTVPHKGIRQVQGDVRDRATVEDAITEGCIVFHLAAVLGVETILRVPLDVMEVNLRGTMNLLNAAVMKRVERFVLASSSEVYGEPQTVPISEDAPLAPCSVYGASKLASEAYCSACSDESGLNTTCIRFFNVYGPGQSEKFVVPMFLQRVARGEPPVIYGDGAQFRSYTYVSDAVNGLVLSAAHPNGIKETFNIGNTQTLTVKELAEMVIRLSGKPLTPIYRSFGDEIRSRQREILSREPDISKARALLKFKPSVAIADGLRLHYATYRDTTES